MGIRRLNNHRNYIRDSADRICEVDDGGGGTSNEISRQSLQLGIYTTAACVQYIHILYYIRSTLDDKGLRLVLNNIITI